MKILSVKAQGYARFEELSVNYDNQGLVLVEGDNQDSNSSVSNGAGKTTAVRDSLLIGLFGRNGDGVNIESRLLGESAKTKIEVNFVGNDGVTYRVIRDYKKGKSKGVEIYREGSAEPLPVFSAKDAQEKINGLLGGDFVCMVNTCIPTSDNGLFSESTEGQQKQILDSILGIDKISKALAAAKGRLATVKVEVDRINGKIYGLIGQMDQVQNSIATLENTKKSIQRQKEEQIKVKQDELVVISQQLEDYNLKIYQTTQQIESQNNSLTGYNPQELQQGLSYYQSEINRLHSERGAADGVIRLRNGEISSIKTKLDNLMRGKIEGDICFNCGAKIDKNNLNSLSRHWSEEIDKLSVEIQQYTDSITQLSNSTSEVSGYVKQYQDAINYLNQTSSHIKQLNTSLESLKQHVETKKALYDRITKDIQAIRSQTDDLDTEIERLRSQVGFLQEEKQQLDQTLASQQYLQQHVEFWIDAFGPGKTGTSLPMYLYNSAIGRFNISLAEYINKLYGSSMYVELSTTKQLISGDEKAALTLKVHNANGSNELALNSKGERKRINLAITFALLELAQSINKVQPNVLILDEIDNYMDEGGIMALLDILNGLSKRIPTIIVITHRSELKDWFKSRWMVSKSNGVSRLQQVLLSYTG